jgi:hypothetical protein
MKTPNVEIWKDVITYEGIYSVSSFGNIRRDLYSGKNTKAGRILKPRLNKYGYPYLNLYKDKIRTSICIHKLVTRAFLGEPPQNYVVNHKDGSKINNTIENLEYCTQKQNVKHSYDTGLKFGNFGERHGSKTHPERVARGEKSRLSKIKECDIPVIFSLRRNGMKLHQIGNLFGVKYQQISRILSGKSRNTLNIYTPMSPHKRSYISILEKR